MGFPLFRLDVDLPEIIESGSVRIVIENLQPAADAAPRPSEEAVSLFALATSRQLFTDPHAEREARCEVVSAARDGTRRTVTFELAMEACPTIDFLVLVSLLAQVSFAGDDIARVQISSPVSESRIGSLFDYTQRFRQLSVPPAVPFHVDVREDVPLSCAAFEFRDPVTRRQFDELRTSFEVWGHVSHLGGYLFDFVEQETFTTEFGEAAHLAPARVEFVWGGFEGWPSAYEPLINVAAHCHRTGMPMKSIALW